MKSINEMQNLVSLIAHGENAEAENKDYVEGVVYELGGGRGDRSVQIEDYVIAATDCSDHYWDKLTAIKLESEEDLNHFIEATEEWMKLIQLADYFVRDKRSKFVSDSQPHLLITKLTEAVKICKNFAFKVAKEKNINLIRLNKILIIAAYYLLSDSNKWIKFVCELCEYYRYSYEKFSKNHADLNEAIKYTEVVLVVNENKKIDIKYLISIYGTLGRIYLCKWQDNRVIENLNQAINFFEKCVIEKKNANQLNTDDNDLHMLSSLSLTMAEDDKQSLEDKLQHYRKALEYADLIGDNRKLCHLYKSLAEYYERNYFVENGKEFVILNTEKTEMAVALKRVYWEAAVNIKKHVEKHNLYTNEFPLPEMEGAKISELQVFVYHYNCVSNNFKEASRSNKHGAKFAYWSKKRQRDVELQLTTHSSKKFSH